MKYIPCEGWEILKDCHAEPAGDYYSTNWTIQKVLQAKFYWLTLFKDAHRFVNSYDNYQGVGNTSQRDEMPQNNILECKVFDVWGINFVGLFPNSFGKKYVLMVVDYVLKWVEAQVLPTNDA